MSIARALAFSSSSRMPPLRPVENSVSAPTDGGFEDLLPEPGKDYFRHC
jgi:hypothetical protein